MELKLELEDCCGWWDVDGGMVRCGFGYSGRGGVGEVSRYYKFSRGGGVSIYLWVCYIGGYWSSVQVVDTCI